MSNPFTTLLYSLGIIAVFSILDIWDALFHGIDMLYTLGNEVAFGFYVSDVITIWLLVIFFWALISVILEKK